MSCYGASISKHRDRESTEQTLDQENKCLEPTSTSPPCLSKTTVAQPEFDEYSAEVNGNQLIVRVHKDDKSHFVTRVFDTDMDQAGNKIQREKNVVSICGCDQQIDFKFPEKFSCGDCNKKSTKCDCGHGSMLTDFQRKTSCIGKSFKNSGCLPAIRGNLKYPGRFDDGSIKFDLLKKCNSRDATEKYKKKPSTSRAACFQVDADNIKRELQGKCKMPNGIEICKKGCADTETDVFILKMGRKNTDKKGHENAIELEMRTPKAPDFETKKMETREIQVDEKDFEEEKKKPVEKNVEVTPTKGFKKKVEAKTAKTPMKKVEIKAPKNKK